jgi:NAD(P)H-hydrate epimerase
MRRVSEVPRVPARDLDTHKGTYGHALLVAGSQGMYGAPILAARAALRAGVGLVTVASGEAAIITPLAAAVPEAMFLSLAQGEVLGPGTAGRFDAIGMGPGIGTSATARAAVEALLASYTGAHVVDADALNLVAANPGMVNNRPANRVWTPHPGEFERLAGEKPRGDAERLAAAERFVAARGGVLVLKGHRTVVADGESVHVNETGNPGMATGGTGDVLTGVITSLLAQRFPPFDAAVLGVWLHGRAGDLAAQELGEASLIAGDVIERLPGAILERQERRREG